MTAEARWASAGQVAFRLPSGFFVRGVYPSITDLTRRGLVPFALRKAVMDSFGKKGDDLTFEDVAANTEQRLRMAAEFLRHILDDEAEEWEWEPLDMTFEKLTGGDFPGDDIEALDSFVMLASTEYSPEEAARLINQQSEIELGLTTLADLVAQRQERREAVATVSGWTRFRDGDRGPDGDADGNDVSPTAIATARDKRSKSRTGGRRRASPTAQPRAAAG